MVHVVQANPSTVATVTTANDVTTSYETYDDAMEAWVDGCTLTLQEDLTSDKYANVIYVTYKGAAQAPMATVTGLVGNDTCSVTVSGAKKNAGTYTATASKLSNANYVLPAEFSTSFTIAKAALTVTAKDKSIAFNAKAANAGVAYSGFKGTDDASSLGGKLAYSYGGYRKGSKAGTYKITPSGLTSKNYKITFKAGTLTVEAPSKVTGSGKALADGKGWIATDEDGVTGTTGENRRLTGVRLDLDALPYSGGIQYRGHFETSGWQKAWTKGNGVCAVGDKRLEALQIRLTGNMAKNYDVYYRVHTQKYGWMAWTKNGAKAGTEGKSLRLEAVQVVALKKGSDAPSKNYGGVKQAYAKAFVE